MSEAPWQLVQLNNAHCNEIQTLFQQVFGSTLSEALWRWKYADHRGLATGTRDRQGHLQAHYGGTVRTLLVQGWPVAAVQLGDVMVAAGARGFFSRNGPFTVAAQGFLQQYIGQNLPFALGFGFPNMRAGRLGEKLGLYTNIDQVQEIVWPCTPLSPAWWQPRLGATPVNWSSPKTARQLDQLWQTMQSQTTGFVIGQRNAAWWTHRYANHPEQGYRCFWLRQRLSRRILGIVALKPGPTTEHPWELLDWVAPLTATATVVQAAHALATGAGANALQGWFSHPIEALLRKAGALQNARLQPVCTACITVRQANGLPNLAQTPWWLTGGDTDFR